MNVANPELQEDDDYLLYCRVCGACGEEGCCPAWICTHAEGCLYPEIYKDAGLYGRIRRIKTVGQVVRWINTYWYRLFHRVLL